ncbi:MAG: serine/threonine-protein kinase [Gemmatimonadota bacterium]
MSASATPSELEILRTGLAERYRVERVLGTGGMAVVYLARDLAHDRDVALKVLRPELAAVTGAERFHREIRLAARLVHPNILPLLDSGVTGGRLWYTMPFIEGESLRSRLERVKQLPIDDAIRLTTEVAEALEHAHAKGILHRDIKPENILLSGGHALVADFGIARALEETGDRLTSTGLALGTPGYMSPEQSTGDRELDARSDQYALASVTYEMLAGEPPFTGPTAQAVIARRLSQAPPSARVIRPSISTAVDDALRRALGPVPADRFPSTIEFARALSAAHTAPSTPVRESSRARWPLIGVVALTVLIAIGVTRVIGRRPSVRGAVTSGTADRQGLRLAIVPFHLIGHDSADQYLADGITEEVTSTLSNLSGLRVIAPGSVAAIDKTGKGPRELGAELGADALVEGELQHAGSAIRVRVSLIDPATEETRWSQKYDHTTQDIFRIQSEVAARVAGLLRIQLAERESRSLGRLPTTNPAAYDVYLRARVIGDRPGASLPAVDSAIEMLGGAVRLDSSFAAAWALRAAKRSEAVFIYDADSHRLDEADEDVRKALALDSTLAIAYAARSDLEWNAVRGWHFAEALADERHAIALRPSFVEANSGLGALYAHYGFNAEAERTLETSLSLDPRDRCEDPTRCTGFSRPRLARVLWYCQQFDSALAVYRGMSFVGGFVWEYAVVLNGVGRPADGLALLDSARVEGIPETGDRVAARALMLAALGRNREALELIQTAVTRPNSRSHFHHAQFTIACAYARLGRKADAVEWLRRTAANGMPNYPLFRSDPNLRNLQGDPAYERLMTDLQRQYEANGRLVRAGER